MRNWLMLTYKVPREPTSSRVYVWRKLKKLGAMFLHDAVWVLPATPQTLEHFRWLAAEIEELEGEATLWEARLVMDGQEEAMVKKFEQQVIPTYQEIMAGIKGKKSDLSALSRAYQQALAKDYFHIELGAKVREALIAAKRGTKQ